jgi:ankyrin repeat protein
MSSHIVFFHWLILVLQIVEDTSSYLNFPTIETTQHIEQNHMDMCRFTGLEDPEYKKVAAALCRMTRAVSKQPRREPLLNEEQKRMLLDSLRFDQIDTRQMTIKNAHAKTCKWLLKKPEYLDWLDITKLCEHHGFLWIKGKPGTGKSTLMKFALANARRTMKDRIIISFFFNARGEDLEKSTMGMYRSLLLQLLERVSELQCDLDSLGLTQGGISGSHQWSVESLKELFGQAVQRLGRSSLACFIDALDECEERQIRDMVSFFEHLGEIAVSAGIRLHVCFSSRHYPHITISKGLGLVLEGQEEHNQDITDYLDSELKIGHSNLAQQVRAELQEKSSGIFMWVVLVVQILNKEHDGGRVHALQRRLRDIPTDLHSLFRDILMRDHYNKNELLLCIQWVLLAKRPLKPEELYFAILSGIEPEDLVRWNRDEITMDVIKRFILNSSKGLAEITRSKIPTVQFIHESVTDFLLKENGLGELWSDLGSSFQGQSHERLKQCCLTYISIDIFTHLNISESLPKASSQEGSSLRQSVAEAFPFLEYAVHSVLYHADTAESGGVAQGDFIQSFQLAGWIKLDNLFEKHEIRRHKPNASLLYILAEGNLSNLIKIHPSNLSYLEVEDERYGVPLFAALASRSDDAVRTFMKLQVESQPTATQLHCQYDQYCHGGNKRPNFGRDFKFSQRRGINWHLAEHSDEILLAFLIEAGKVFLDTEDDEGRTLLSWAVEKGNLAVVNLLLRYVDPDSRDKDVQTLIFHAASKGYATIVQLLLRTGNVDVDSRDNTGRTPLSYAALNGQEAVVKLLLQTGKVDAGSRDDLGQTPLSGASLNGHEGIVKLLLETCSLDTNSRVSDGGTPLLYAAKWGHEGIVKLLLETGTVDAGSRDNGGKTPLSHASFNGYEGIVKLLLETGSVDVDARDENGRTSLWTATGLSDVSKAKGIVQLLLETGKADPHIADKNGMSPLSRAQQRGSDSHEIAEMLRTYARSKAIRHKG